MAEFVLDTSGSVELQPMTETEGSVRVRWSDLSPFCQGYVEGLFASLPERWVCDECEHRGIHKDGSNARSWCDNCQDDFPSEANLCPGCRQDSLRSACPKCAGRWSADDPQPGFSDLSPAALELILKDCARAQELVAWHGSPRMAGYVFWRIRNGGHMGAPAFYGPIQRAFNPLRPVLSDEGKVDLQPE